MKMPIRMSLLVCTIALFNPLSPALAQTASPGPAAVVEMEDWHGVMETSKANNILDTKVNETPIKGGLIRIGIVHRTKPETRALIHQELTEVYYVVEGSGTLITGGGVEDKRQISDPANLGLTPSFFVGQIGGETKQIGPGDIVVIPAGLPHRLIELDGPMSYIIYRFEAIPE